MYRGDSEPLTPAGLCTEWERKGTTARGQRVQRQKVFVSSCLHLTLSSLKVKGLRPAHLINSEGGSDNVCRGCRGGFGWFQKNQWLSSLQVGWIQIIRWNKMLFSGSKQVFFHEWEHNIILALIVCSVHFYRLPEFVIYVICIC